MPINYSPLNPPKGDIKTYFLKITGIILYFKTASSHFKVDVVGYKKTATRLKPPFWGGLEGLYL